MRKLTLLFLIAGICGTMNGMNNPIRRETIQCHRHHVNGHLTKLSGRIATLINPHNGQQRHVYCDVEYNALINGYAGKVTNPGFDTSIPTCEKLQSAQAAIYYQKLLKVYEHDQERENMSTEQRRYNVKRRVVFRPIKTNELRINDDTTQTAT